MQSQAEAGHPVFRPGGVSYLHIPTDDPARSAAFYRVVFGWSVGGDPERPSFEDGTGHVIGHWVTDAAPAGEAGVRPYIFVDRLEDTLAQATAHGGDVVQAPYPEGELWVATIKDPAGNVVGVWQKGPI